MSPVTGVGAGTRLYGVLGFPVRHSLSPRMQTAAFAALGLDACYLAFEVRAEDFDAAVDGAAKLGFGGLSVTVPHKERAFLAARERDVSAELIGAVNTLVPLPLSSGGGWKGYNTDAAGFVAALRGDLGFVPRGRRAAVLGAGGAARAAVVGLAAAGAGEILLANRNPARAEALVEELGPRVDKICGTKISAVAVADLPARLGAGDLLASSTPLGLDPSGRWPWPMGELPAGLLLYDMAYGPGRTSLEAQAREAGFTVSSGRRMLVMQGAEAFRLWTGLEPPVDVMEKAVFE
jgi:shikimate dehydrogenase